MASNSLVLSAVSAEKLTGRGGGMKSAQQLERERTCASYAALRHLMVMELLNNALAVGNGYEPTAPVHLAFEDSGYPRTEEEWLEAAKAAIEEDIEIRWSDKEHWLTRQAKEEDHE